MKIKFIEPSEELKPYIKFIWIFESPDGMPVGGTNMAAPNGSPKLIFSYQKSINSVVDGKIQRSIENCLYFAGNRDISVQVHTSSKKTGFIGIEFYPQGAYPVFGIPMHEMANHLLPVELIIPAQGKIINEGLAGLPDMQDKINFLQEWLKVLINKKHLQNPLADYCVKMLSSTNGMTSVRDLEQMTGYSGRYLEILLKNYVGFSPKTLARIFRFQKFYRKWAGGLSYDEFKKDLYDHYYDQAHFIRDFKQMTGFSPQYFTENIRNQFGRLLSLQYTSHFYNRNVL